MNELLDRINAVLGAADLLGDEMVKDAISVVEFGLCSVLYSGKATAEMVVADVFDTIEKGQEAYAEVPAVMLFFNDLLDAVLEVMPR